MKLLTTILVTVISLSLSPGWIHPQEAFLAQPAETSAPRHPESSVALLRLAALAKLKENARGHVLVINFWATWCHGCVAEFPEFVALDEKYREKGVMIVGISLDNRSDIDSKVVPFIKRSKARFDILVPDMDDPQPVIDAVTKEWPGAMPATFIFDQQGKLAYQRFGVIERDLVTAALESLLKR